MDYEEWYDKIYRYCYYRLHQKETAEDITQETFLRFFQKERHWLGEYPLKAMYTIARNLCIDERRKKKPVSLEDAGQWEEGLCGKNMEDEILNGRILREAVEKLEQQERDILFLRIVNGEPLSVIGQMFHLSRYAVYRRCQNALKKLRKELDK